jgi:hypothetical protein
MAETKSLELTDIPRGPDVFPDGFECRMTDMLQALRHKEIQISAREADSEMARVWSPPRGGSFNACIDYANSCIADRTVYFVIKVTLPSGSCWSVDKRFSEFVELRDSLQSDGVHHPGFERSFWEKEGEEEDLTEERITELNGFICSSLLKNDDNDHVRAFLQLDEPVLTNPEEIKPGNTKEDGIRFLEHPNMHSIPKEAQVKFLKQQGFSDEIIASCYLAMAEEQNQSASYLVRPAYTVQHEDTPHVSFKSLDYSSVALRGAPVSDASAIHPTHDQAADGTHRPMSAAERIRQSRFTDS